MLFAWGCFPQEADLFMALADHDIFLRMSFLFAGIVVSLGFLVFGTVQRSFWSFDKHLFCFRKNFEKFFNTPNPAFRQNLSLSQSFLQNFYKPMYIATLISKNAVRNTGTRFRNSWADKPVKLFINRSDFNALSISMTIFPPFLSVRSSYHFFVLSLAFISLFYRATNILFPILYLLLLVPPPLGILDQLTLPMRYSSSVASAFILKIFHYPVTREGLLLTIGEHEIFMGAPCSGLRSLITMIALGLVYILGLSRLS